MIKKDKINCHGSIVVEAAVIVPIVIIAVMIVIYILLIIFQSCIMQVVANNVSERAAAIWFNPHAAFETSKITKQDIVNLDLYRRWDFDSCWDKEELEELAANQMQKVSVLKGRDVKVDVLHQNTLLSQKVTVRIAASYKNPLGGLMGNWGFGKNIQLGVEAQSVTDDPVEFIRNSDFILETASRVPFISEFESKWNEIVSRILEYVNSLAKGEKAN